MLSILRNILYAIWSFFNVFIDKLLYFLSIRTTILFDQNWIFILNNQFIISRKHLEIHSLTRKWAFASLMHLNQIMSNYQLNVLHLITFSIILIILAFNIDSILISRIILIIIPVILSLFPFILFLQSLHLNIKRFFIIHSLLMPLNCIS